MPATKPLAPADIPVLGHIPTSAQGYVLADRARTTQAPIIHICTNDKAMDACATVAQAFAPDIPVYTFPAWDCLPYDRVSPSHAILAQRITTLTSLLRHQNTPFILVTTLGAATQKLPPKSVLSSATFTIAQGERLDRDALIHFLVHHGYSRIGKVMEPGEFAIRGSIIDLFAPDQPNAVRIDLFDDELESIKPFDPLSQVTSGDVIPHLTLQPINEILLQDSTITRFRSGYREQFGAVTKNDPLYESISESRPYAGMEHWLPLFYETLDTLFDYAPRAAITADYEVEATYRDRLETLDDYYQARQTGAALKDQTPYHPLPPESLYLLEDAWHRTVKNATIFSPHSAADTLPLKPAPQFHSARHQHGDDRFAPLRDAISKRTAPTLIACYSAGSTERMATLLKAQGLAVEQSDHIPARPTGTLTLITLPIEHGFDSPEFLLLSEQDILGERIIRTQKRKKASEAFMAEAANFSAGELIVHREHGIGRFDGLITLDVNHRKHDCLQLVYAGDDKLFLPVENMEMIHRFGSEAEGVALDKLGAASWQKRKASMKQRVQMAAEELLKIAAKRALRAAPELIPDAALYSEFCARFPYAETEDQQSAIDDVLTDLRSGHPMDRLICGDVGFGKTEVALRAAFAAVSAGEKVQVALIAPTTLLARQHYMNFAKRFEGFPITVKPLSRLVSAKDATATKDALKDGKVDIIIGTHSLLAKDVRFQNLGLVIVDEEQHFGVAQKERLKRLRTNTHVLTLSATPIPRTLQMALSGVRELSLITTPPVDRLAVRSFVMPYDGVVIREAILREYHRGGKSFYVTPRIKYMADLQVKLRELVPDLKIAVANGQMAAGALDQLMNDFYDGKYDILLSTAIIESGLDVPSANTMIIDHAEMFGLSQLYQLRGRVGRGKIRAYSYFTLPHKKLLTKEATKRLEVMQTLDTLGAGFTLASHDMDIRGFGNLVGEEQSGHVREVGIELYQEMLREAIEQQKHGGDDIAAAPADEWSPQINLGSSVLIPEHYVEDLGLRMSLYRRLSSMDTHDEIESFAAELVDRFGPLPKEVTQLFDVLHIKQGCKKAGIERIDTGPKGAVLSFRNNHFANPAALLQHIAQHPRQFKLRQDQKLVLLGHWKNAAQRYEAINKAVEEIVGLVG